MTLDFIIIAIVYFTILGLFAWYGFLNVRQGNTIIDWNRKTDIEIQALKDRNLDLEKRVKALEQSDRVNTACINKQADCIDRLLKEVFDEDPITEEADK